MSINTFRHQQFLRLHMEYPAKTLQFFIQYAAFIPFDLTEQLLIHRNPKLHHFRRHGPLAQTRLFAIPQQILVNPVGIVILPYVHRASALPFMYKLRFIVNYRSQHT